MFLLACERLALGLLASSCIALPLSGQQTTKPVASGSPAPVAGSTAAVSPRVILEGNELSCLTDDSGDVCRAATFVRGTWPQPTSDQYIFGAGIGLAGIVAEDASFAWAGDTIASYFFDLRGTQGHGVPITGIYSSTRPEDVATWPDQGDIGAFPFASGRIEPGPFHPIHAGKAAISDQDTWVLAWEGDPRLSANREHPLGIAVEQRTMQWTAPEGLQSVIFLVYRLTNVTDLPVFRDTIAATYFDGNAGALPVGGWRIDSLFVGFTMDNDVSTAALDNYALLLPGFDAALSYHQAFTAEEFDYPADVFYPPFLGNSPGIVASALLHVDPDPDSESTPGARMMSVTTNTQCGVGFCDPVGTELWRYLSGHFGAMEAQCNVPDPSGTRACFQAFVPIDVRHFQSVGPYSLGPGEQATVVFAMAVAPTADVPGLVIGGDNPPEPPAPAPGCDGDPIGTIAAAAGWVSTPECPAPGEWLDPDRVETLEGSLLHRIQIARDFVAHGFVMPFAPERPEFHLLPGDTSVTVVWGRSQTEALGDPYYQIARDSTGALYNPNYRHFDVEGYRIYRSTDGRNWREVAQFDYDTTTFADVLCETDRTHATGEPCTDERIVWINDIQDFPREPLTQYRPGDVVRTANGNIAVLHADTVSAGHLELRDNGVPFAWEDTDLRLGFRYYYQVRAFDVNSYRSGPSSLESASEVESVIVQPQFETLAVPSLEIRIEGADGVALDLSAPLPEIDSLSGTFSGPMPPTNALEWSFVPDLPRLLPAFRLEMRIDSVRLGPTPAAPCTEGTDQLGACWRLFHTVDRDGVRSVGWTDGWTPVWDAFGPPGAITHSLFSAEVAADAATLEAIGAAQDAFFFTANVDALLDESIFNSASEGQVNRRAGGAGLPADLIAGGSRWFDGTEETVPDPTRFIRVGHLTGVDTVWAPIHHTDIGDGTAYPASGSMQCYSYAVSGIARVADIRVTWQNGTITAEDVTHDVPVEFKPIGQQSWGFVRDGNANGMIDWQDFDYIDGIAPVIRVNGFCTQPPAGSETQLSQTPVVMATSTQGVASGFSATGRGFGLYINAQRFIFETPGGARPANGTVWTLRNYHGLVQAASGAATANPSGYTFVDARGGSAGVLQQRPPMVPGLRVVFESTEAAHFAGAPDLTRIHTVPDPYYYHSFFGPDDRGRLIRFVNLPPQATIRIFSLAGVLVDLINHNDPMSGIATWDLRTRDGATAASGVYFFHVSTPAGEEHIGRFTIVTSGGFTD